VERADSVVVVGGIKATEAQLLIDGDPKGNLRIKAGTRIPLKGSFRLVDRAQKPTPVAVDIGPPSEPHVISKSGFGTLGTLVGDRLSFDGVIHAPMEAGNYSIRVWQGHQPAAPLIERRLVVE